MSKKPLNKQLVKAKAPNSTSGAIVPASGSAINGSIVRPTTQRALILRNGKHGAMGTGELVSANRMSGREKLDLLAEDEMKQAVAPPLSIEVALKIAQASLDFYLDDISGLQNADLCYGMMEADLQAYMPPSKDKTEPDFFTKPRWIAEQFGSRVHNTYMLAGAWRLVVQGLKELQATGLVDQNVRNQLRQNERMRIIYMVVFNMAQNIVAIYQQKLCYIAHFTPHYAQYFKLDNDTQEPKLEFDLAALRDVYKSFLDSIVIELCLPGSKYPPAVLYTCLKESAKESPKELKRFPQAMWDAIGDLADAIRLFELLETPLLTPQGEVWKRAVPIVPDQFWQWEEAQDFSIRISKDVSSYLDFIFPLSNLQNKGTVDKLWKAINENYRKGTGMELDSLWQLTKARKRTPHWNPIFVSKSDLQGDSDSEYEVPKGLKSAVTAARSQRNKPLTLTRGEDDFSDLPGLESASDSSDEESSTESSNDDNGSNAESVSYVESEEDYDSDLEDDFRQWARDALELNIQAPEIFNEHFQSEADLADEKTKNPFMKLLGALRGRFNPSNSTMKTSQRAAPAKPQPDWKGKGSNAFANFKPSKSATLGPEFHQATVEDIEEDDDEVPKADKKKKKKKPKKKKKKSTFADAGEGEASEDEELVQSLAPVPESVLSKPSLAPTTPTKKPAAVAKSPAKPAVKAPSVSSSILAGTASTTTLPLPREETAQSARAYLKSAKLDESKVKVKSRPDEATKSAGFMANLRGKLNEKEIAPKSVVEDKSSLNIFSGLRKKSVNYMAKLLGKERKGQLKWDQFETVMMDMGFTIDRSTAGSSIRFDPPNPKDEPITFHKGHPDSTLGPVMLKQIGTRLRNKYGWSDDKLSAALAANSKGKAYPGEIDSDDELY